MPNFNGKVSKTLESFPSPTPRTRKTLLLTSKDVIGVSKTSLPTLKRWVSEGALPCIKLGRRKRGRVRDNRPVRFKVSDVAKFMNLTPDEIYAALETPEQSGVEK